jgi:hypothetical protein
LRGAATAFPDRSASGTVYLQKTTHEEKGEKLELIVHRRVTDDMPLVLTTRIELNVAGKRAAERRRSNGASRGQAREAAGFHDLGAQPYCVASSKR